MENCAGSADKAVYKLFKSVILLASIVVIALIFTACVVPALIVFSSAAVADVSVTVTAKAAFPLAARVFNVSTSPSSTVAVTVPVVVFVRSFACDVETLVSSIVRFMPANLHVQQFYDLTELCETQLLFHH